MVANWSRCWGGSFKGSMQRAAKRDLWFLAQMQEPRTTCQAFVNPLDWVFNVRSTIDFLRTYEPLDIVCKKSFMSFLSVCAPVHFSGKDHQLWSYSQRSPWLKKVYAHCLVLLGWLLRPSDRPLISWQLPVSVLLTVTWMDLPGGLVEYAFSSLPCF